MRNGLPQWHGSAEEAAGLFSPHDWEYSDLLQDFKKGGSTFDTKFARRNPKALSAVSDAGLRYAIGPYLDACIESGQLVPDMLESVIFHLSPSDPDGQFWCRRKELLTSDDIELMVQKMHKLARLQYVNDDTGLRRDLAQGIALWQAILDERTQKRGGS